MTEQTPLPPPFIVSEIYEDEISKYRVLSVEGTRMTFERLDRIGVETGDISFKARIHRRRIFEQQQPRWSVYERSKAVAGSNEYTYADVTPLVAKAIDEHSKRSRQYIPHRAIKETLLRDSDARLIIDRLPPTDKLKTAEAWAGVIIAGFSKQWTEGHWPRFERKKIGVGHAWRVKK